MPKMNRREQVKALIDEGGKTRKQIAEALGVKETSVSSQLTYLRWMGFFIRTNEDKTLSFCTEEEFQAQKKAQANRKTKTTARTPNEQSVALAKTIASQTKAKAKWDAKLVDLVDALSDAPEDEDLLDDQIEAQANSDLLKIKLKRNMAKAETLPDPEEAAAIIKSEQETEPDETEPDETEPDETEPDETEDEDLL